MLIRVLEVLASPGWGGAEKVFVELCQDLHRSGEVEVVALVSADSDVEARLEESLVPTRSLRRGSRRNPLVLKDLRRQIREVRPSIVHTHQAKASEMAYWANRRTGAVHAATTHNARRRVIYRRLEHVSAVSRAVADFIDHPKGIEVIYNGIDVRAVDPGPRPERFTVAAVGRISPYKRFHLLVQAIALVDDVDLVIAGDGPGRHALGAIASDLGVADRLRLLGHREDVPEILASSHLQIVPSSTEGFGLALLEGLHYAPVVVATPVGIATEVLTPEWILDDASPSAIAERIRLVKEDPVGAAERFAPVARAHRDRFTRAATFRAYVNWFRRLEAADRDAGAAPRA